MGERVLLVGGAGYVGTMITPYLRRHHAIRVLDVAPPADPDVEWVEGSIADPAALDRAFTGVDTFVNLVMKGGRQDGRVPDQTIEMVQNNHEVNSLGTHLMLLAAVNHGVKRGVHSSSVTVHYRDRPYFPSEDEVPLDSPSPYGLTKGHAEAICRYFCRWFDMNIIALRLTGPRTAAEWEAAVRSPGGRLKVTHEEDLARAYLLALDKVRIGHGAFAACYISGDPTDAEWNLTKARWLLGWEPRPMTP